MVVKIKYYYIMIRGFFFLVGGLFSMLCGGVVCGPFDIRDFNQSALLGTWVQVYSNRFIQETQEVAWKCVTVNVTQKEGSGQLQVTKNAYLHGNRSDPVSHSYAIRIQPPTKDQVNSALEDDMSPIIYQSDEETQPEYILREYDEQYEYVLWTKTDNVSLYVWTRNVIEFKVNDDWKVLEKYVYWNYTGYYKFPLASYSFQCMRHRHNTTTSLDNNPP